MALLVKTMVSLYNHGFKKSTLYKVRTGIQQIGSVSSRYMWTRTQTDKVLQVYANHDAAGQHSGCGSRHLLKTSWFWRLSRISDWRGNQVGVSLQSVNGAQEILRDQDKDRVENVKEDKAEKGAKGTKERRKTSSLKKVVLPLFRCSKWSLVEQG